MFSTHRSCNGWQKLSISLLWLFILWSCYCPWIVENSNGKWRKKKKTYARARTSLQNNVVKMANNKIRIINVTRFLMQFAINSRLCFYRYSLIDFMDCCWSVVMHFLWFDNNFFLPSYKREGALVRALYKTRVSVLN